MGAPIETLAAGRSEDRVAVSYVSGGVAVDATVVQCGRGASVAEVVAFLEVDSFDRVFVTFPEGAPALAPGSARAAALVTLEGALSRKALAVPQTPAAKGDLVCRECAAQERQRQAERKRTASHPPWPSRPNLPPRHH